MMMLASCGDAGTTTSASGSAASSASGPAKSSAVRPSGTPVASGSAAPKTSAAPPSTPPGKPRSIEANAASEFDFEGNKVALKYAYVYFANSPIVRLTSHESKCDGSKTLPKDFSSLEFHLFPGPGGKYFAGAPTTVRSAVLNAPFRDKLKTTDFEDSATLVEIEPFKYAKGEHIKGKVVLDYANKDLASKGSAVFDAEICDDSAPKGKGVAETAPEGPITGTMGGKPFTGKKVFAKTGTLDDGKTKAITALYVVQGEATCQDYDKQQNRLWISAFGAANEKQNLTNAPVWFFLHFIDDSQRDYSKGKYQLGQTWLSFDNLSYEKGAVVKGSLVASLPQDEKAPAAELGGRFEATICN